MQVLLDLLMQFRDGSFFSSPEFLWEQDDQE